MSNGLTPNAEALLDEVFGQVKGSLFTDKSPNLAAQGIAGVNLSQKTGSCGSRVTPMTATPKHAMRFRYRYVVSMYNL
jgi:hypothetical protein